MAVGLDRRCPDERDHVMRDMGAAGPDLGAGELPAALHGYGAAADRGEVGARIGLAHADAEIGLAAADAGQEALALRLGAEAQQERPALAVGGPVRGDRGAGDEDLLGDDVALARGALAAAVAALPGPAGPTLRAEAASG